MTVRKVFWSTLKIVESLRRWKEMTRYADLDDWVFAGPRRKGKQPLRPDGVLSKIIRLAALRAGINKRIGLAHIQAHLFVNANCKWRKREGGSGINASRQQSLHPGGLQWWNGFSVDWIAAAAVVVGGHTQAKAKREAQHRIVEMLLPPEGLAEIRQRKAPPEILGGDAS